MDKIQNYDCYLTKMSKTFFDKAWFMSHIPEDVDTIIDFGCADGSFLKFLQSVCPKFIYIGIDNNPKMVKLTKDKGFECYSSIKELEARVFDFNGNGCCLILNSVIHEIYSYFNESIIDQIYSFHPKYIAIRDMMFNPIDRARFYLPINDYKKIINLFEEKYPIQFNEFHEIWKNKQDYETEIVHFLLKYIYNNENWSREVKENYLPIDIQEIRRRFCLNTIFPKYNYTIDFQSFYKLPYLVNRWRQDFELDKNFELSEFIRNINTHYKMLLKC